MEPNVNPITYREFFKRFITIMVVLMLVLSFWYLRQVWLTAFLAIILAVGVSVPAGWLQKRGWPRGWSNVASFISIAFIGTILTIYTLPTIVQEAGHLILGLPEVFESAVNGYDEWRLGNETLTSLLPPSNANADELADALEAVGITTTDIVSFGYSVISTGLGSLPVLEGVGAIVGILTNLAIVVVIALFLLIEPRTYIKASLLLAPFDYQPRLVEIWQALYDTLTNWLTAQLLSFTVTVGLVWFILGVLIGMPFSLVVALFAGFATFIPNVGVFLPLIPITIFTLADDPSRLIYAIPVYLLIQLFESNIISPSIVKRELAIPAGAVLTFQVVAATLFGAGGILLAVPMLAVLITLIREIYSFNLLGLTPADVELVTDAQGNLQLKRLQAPTPIAVVEEEEPEMQSITSPLPAE